MFKKSSPTPSANKSNTSSPSFTSTNISVCHPNIQKMASALHTNAYQSTLSTTTIPFQICYPAKKCSRKVNCGSSFTICSILSSISNSTNLPLILISTISSSRLKGCLLCLIIRLLAPKIVLVAVRLGWVNF